MKRVISKIGKAAYAMAAVISWPVMADAEISDAPPAVVDSLKETVAQEEAVQLGQNEEVMANSIARQTESVEEGGVKPLAETVESYTFPEARTKMYDAPKFSAAEAAEEAAHLQSRATQWLGGPNVVLSGHAMRYGVEKEIHVSDMLPSDITLPIVGSIPIPKNIVGDVDFKKNGHASGATVMAAWPVFTGGRIHAVQKVMKAREQEAGADKNLTALELNDTLAERYFGSQLAEFALGLHTQAYQTIERFDYTAKRMLDEGLISRVERLQAAAKLADAATALEKARNDAHLAAMGLSRLIGNYEQVKPLSPLFVYSKPLQPLAYFQDLAMQFHPGLDKVAAKKSQAQALHQAGEARYLPVVTLVGGSDISHKKPNWVAGVTASWTLWSGLDRRNMLKASAKNIEQAEFADEDLRQNLMLLTEKNWRAAEAARVAYLNMSKNVDLYREVLRLRTVGQREGVNTIPEVMEAQTQLLKAQTERAKVANDYVQALAKLVSGVGRPELFDFYMQKADIRLAIPE